MDKIAYYARPISIDNTPQFERDKELIRKCGFEPWPRDEDKPYILAEYKKVGMVAFKESVLESHVVFYRAFPDGSIGAGVYEELIWAREAGIPIVEIPRQIDRRALTVAQTRDMLTELGQR